MGNANSAFNSINQGFPMVTLDIITLEGDDCFQRARLRPRDLAWEEVFPSACSTCTNAQHISGFMGNKITHQEGGNPSPQQLLVEIMAHARDRRSIKQPATGSVQIKSAYISRGTAAKRCNLVRRYQRLPGVPRWISFDEKRPSPNSDYKHRMTHFFHMDLMKTLRKSIRRK